MLMRFSEVPLEVSFVLILSSVNTLAAPESRSSVQSKANLLEASNRSSHTDMGSTNGTNGCALSSFKHIPLSYNPADSHASALRLVLALNPQWEGPGNKIEFVRFTDGITNTVCSSNLQWAANCRTSTDMLCSCSKL